MPPKQDKKQINEGSFDQDYSPMLRTFVKGYSKNNVMKTKALK